MRRTYIPLLLLSFLFVVGLGNSSSFAGQIPGITVHAWHHEGEHVLGNLVDGDRSTAWVISGAHIGPDGGIELTFPGPVQLESLVLVNGNHGAGQWESSRRVRTGVLLYPDNTLQEFSLTPDLGVHRITLQPKTVTTLRISVAEVDPSPEGVAPSAFTVAISEIEVFGTVKEPEDTSAKGESARAQLREIVRKEIVASRPGATRLRASVPVASNRPLAAGVISPWLDLDMVAQIQRYFALLTTLNDRYPDIFAASIREREQAVFTVIQDAMRAENQFAKQHLATVDHLGLSFDKPIIRDSSAMVRAYGPYRYTIEGQAFEYPVDTLFSFVKEGGKWMINGVQDK